MCACVDNQVFYSVLFAAKQFFCFHLLTACCISWLFTLFCAKSTWSKSTIEQDSWRPSHHLRTAHTAYGWMKYTEIILFTLQTINILTFRSFHSLALLVFILCRSCTRIQFEYHIFPCDSRANTFTLLRIAKNALNAKHIAWICWWKVESDIGECTYYFTIWRYRTVVFCVVNWI